MTLCDRAEDFADHVLDHYRDPYHWGRCESPTHVGEGRLPLCGAMIQITLRVENEIIEEAWFDQRGGCVVSQAAASALVERIEGVSIKEARSLTPQQHLRFFEETLAVNRQRCAMLSWRGLQLAMDNSIDPDDPDQDGTHFGGPSLAEES